MKAQSATPGLWDPPGTTWPWGGNETTGGTAHGRREEEDAGEERETEGRRVEGAPRGTERKKGWRNDRHRCKSLLSSQRKKQTGRWTIRWNKTLKVRGPERQRRERQRQRQPEKKRRTGWHDGAMGEW